MKLSKDKLFDLLDEASIYKNGNIKAICPWCGKKEFYVSLSENHPFQCWRKKHCGESGNIFKLLEKLNRLEFFSYKDDVVFSNRVPETLQIEEDDEVEIDIPEIKKPLGFKRIYDDEYLSKRGFAGNDFSDYIVGITKLDPKLIGYIIFLLFQEGKNIGYVARYKGSKEECDLKNKPRYRNSDSDFEKILGGYDDLVEGKTETVFLVEGLFDKKRIDDLLDLKSVDDLKCVFTFKCFLSNTQIRLLQKKGVKNLIMLYDPDVINKIRVQAIDLVKFFNVKIGLIDFYNEDGNLKDPAELSLEELSTLLKKLYLPLDFFRSKVQVLNL